MSFLPIYPLIEGQEDVREELVLPVPHGMCRGTPEGPCKPEADTTALERISVVKDPRNVPSPSSLLFFAFIYLPNSLVFFILKLLEAFEAP